MPVSRALYASRSSGVPRTSVASARNRSPSVALLCSKVFAKLPRPSVYRAVTRNIPATSSRVQGNDADARPCGSRLAECSGSARDWVLILRFRGAVVASSSESMNTDLERLRLHRLGAIAGMTRLAGTPCCGLVLQPPDPQPDGLTHV